MSVKTRKTSPSTDSQRAPVGSRKGVAAAPAAKGADGAALAQQFIAEWDDYGRREVAIRVSMKDKLLALCKMDEAGITAFHGAMLDKIKAINDAKDDAKLANEAITNLAKFFEHVAPEMQYTYTQASNWKTLALAVAAGWRPTPEEVKATGWFQLMAVAAEKVKGIGAASNDPTKPQLAKGKAGTGRGRKPSTPKTPVQKAVAAVTNALKDEKGNALPKNNRNLSEVVAGLLVDATIEELTEVAAVVQNAMDKARKAAEDTAKALAKTQSAVAKGQTVPASGKTRAAGKTEHAQARK